jgi:hypothetical protein
MRRRLSVRGCHREKIEGKCWWLLGSVRGLGFNSSSVEREADCNKFIRAATGGYGRGRQWFNNGDWLDRRTTVGGRWNDK